MKLEEYLQTREVTQEAFAVRVGVSQGTISRLLPQDGRPPLRKPSIGLAARITRETGGLVTANDFIDSLSTEESPAVPEVERADS